MLDFKSILLFILFTRSYEVMFSLEKEPNEGLFLSDVDESHHKIIDDNIVDDRIEFCKPDKSPSEILSCISTGKVMEK